MLCDLAVHVTEDETHVLRISGKTVRGPSGAGGRDTKSYAAAEELRNDLLTMGLSSEMLTAATQALATPDVRHRFLMFAENVQIPFETLKKVDVDLFD